MNIPNFLNTPPINPETGDWTPEWSNLMQQLFTQLQSNLGPEGFVISQQSTANIAALTDASKSTAAIIYDSTVPAFKGNVGGTWKTFTLT